MRVDCLKSSFAPPFPSFGFAITGSGLRFCEAPEAPRRETAVNRAVEFLRVELADAPKPYSALVERAAENGISEGTLFRARKALGIVTVNGRWSLPYEGGGE